MDETIIRLHSWDLCYPSVQNLLSVCLAYTNTKTESEQAVILSGIMYVDAVLLIKGRKQTTEI
jgi:hypothetical protein